MGCNQEVNYANADAALKIISGVLSLCHWILRAARGNLKSSQDFHTAIKGEMKWRDGF
jgi:hypothetical protein